MTTSSYHSSDYSTSYSSGSVVSDGPPSEPGPGAPFPETFEEREARLLKTLNASMETNVKYWDRELERGVEARDDAFEARLAMFRRSRRISIISPVARAPMVCRAQLGERVTSAS